MFPRLRTALSAALIALACLLLPFGALAAWTAYGLADTGRYVHAMAPLAGDPAVQDAVADTVGDGLAHELHGDTEQPYLRDAVRSFTGTAAFRAGWDQANRSAHDAVLRALRGEGTGPVTIDLAAVTARVKHRLTADHVPLARHIPVTHRQVAVVPAGELPHLRKGFQVMEFAAVWLPGAAVLLAAAGITVATCRRRAVTATALGTALGGALLGVAVAVGRHLTVSDLPEGVSAAAAGAVYDALTESLRTASWLLLALGLTAAAATRLTGTAGRRSLTPAAPRPRFGRPRPQTPDPSRGTGTPPRPGYTPHGDGRPHRDP